MVKIMLFWVVRCLAVLMMFMGHRTAVAMLLIGASVWQSRACLARMRQHPIHLARTDHAGLVDHQYVVARQRIASLLPRMLKTGDRTRADPGFALQIFGCDALQCGTPHPVATPLPYFACNAEHRRLAGASIADDRGQALTAGYIVERVTRSPDNLRPRPSASSSAPTRWRSETPCAMRRVSSSSAFSSQASVAIFSREVKRSRSSPSFPSAIRSGRHAPPLSPDRIAPCRRNAGR
jgi:hypothetical protein